MPTTIALTPTAEPATARSGVDWTLAREFASRRLHVEFPPSIADQGFSERSQLISDAHIREAGSDRTQKLDARRRLSLEILDGDGHVVADRVITVRSRTISDTHIRVVGSDRTQTLDIELLAPRVRHADLEPTPSVAAGGPRGPHSAGTITGDEEPPKFNIRFDAGAKAPAVVLPVLRFLQHLHAPNLFAISIDTDDGPRRLAIQEVPVDAPDPAPAAWLDAVRSLAFVQRAAEVTFPIPDNFTSDDLNGLRRAETLLRGNAVEGHWETLTLTLTGDAVDEFELGQLYMLEQEGEYRITIAGHHLPIGDAYHSFRSARVVSRTTDTVSFEPGPYREYAIRLTEPPARQLDDQLGPLVQLDADFLRSATR